MCTDCMRAVRLRRYPELLTLFRCVRGFGIHTLSARGTRYVLHDVHPDDVAGVPSHPIW